MTLLRTTRKTAAPTLDRAQRHQPAVRSSAPPKPMASSFPDWWRAAAPFALYRWLICALMTGGCALPVLATDWRPIDPADLASKQSKTDPNADAEALFRDVRVLNELHGAGYPTNIVSEYVRLKIWTNRGKEQSADIQIPYFQESTIFNVQGRTIHSDGTIIPLTKDSIFYKVIQKRGIKVKVVSIAMPSVEPGSIIEYSFSKNEGERSYRYRELEVQSEYPVNEVNFYIKPLSTYVGAPTMRYMQFGCVPVRGKPTFDGFDVLSVKNVPAYHEEPYSPPERSSKQWILIYYEENGKTKQDKFWTALGKAREHDLAEQIKINGEIKNLASELTSGAATDEDKLEKLLSFCRTKLKNINGDEITTAELSKAKANRTTIDTIRRKEGDNYDIMLAFIALAKAAGFDARLAELSDRSSFLFAPNMESEFFLNAYDAAVDVGGKWKFFDVSDPTLPGGQLNWHEQGVYALIIDNKNPEMVVTPMLSSAETRKNRFATFTLSDQDVLEGTVREILSGNAAAVWRQENRNTNDAQREDALREELKARFADFELSDVKFTASPDLSKPVSIVYHLLIRNYAQLTGKRLFLQPNYFAAGFGNRFPESSRHNAVYFEYPWSESDVEDITIPAGFELDHGDAPAPVDIPPTVKYSVRIGFDKEHNKLEYRRGFVFGQKDLLIFEAKIYPDLKKVFDVMHDADNHMLTFKAAAAPASGGSGSLP